MKLSSVGVARKGQNCVVAVDKLNKVIGISGMPLSILFISPPDEPPLTDRPESPEGAIKMTVNVALEARVQLAMRETYTPPTTAVDFFQVLQD